MKRLLPVCLCLLFLFGCGAPAQPTVPATEPPPIVTQPPTEPAGLYEPDSTLEQATGGALKCYPLNNAYTHSVTPMGDALLLFQTSDATTLTKLSGVNLSACTSVTLDCSIYLEDPAVRVSDAGITYYNPIREELVFLDSSLEETDRFSMPEGITGAPALSQDRKSLYYLTDSGLRVKDLETGLDRLLREMHFWSQSIAKLYFEDSILECSVSGGDGSWRQVYLDTATGALVQESLEYTALYTNGNRYFATHMDGSFTEKLTGTLDGDMRMLYFSAPDSNAFPVLGHGGLVLSSLAEQTLTFDYYNLFDGTRPYSLELPADCYPWSFTADPKENCLWFLWYDEERGSDILTRWDLDQSTIEDDTVYLGLRRTAEDPDRDGLEDCRELADALSRKYGIRVLTWTDATAFQPWDYSLEPEHQVTVLQEGLAQLEQALSNFPEGFFRQAVSEMGDGFLRIGLVRGIYGIEGGDTLEAAAGLQYWDDFGNAHITLQVGDGMEQNFYHELFHVAESRILGRTDSFDRWDDLNPEGFRYDYEYTSYLGHSEYDLISGDTRAFIDYYAMTYPKEDRARIMEFAMTRGNEDCFSSTIMQNKLRTLCIGIRIAYGLEAATESFLWEQYLAVPIRAYG